jgi:hypothetical protein
MKFINLSFIVKLSLIVFSLIQSSSLFAKFDAQKFVCEGRKITVSSSIYHYWQQADRSTLLNNISQAFSEDEFLIAIRSAMMRLGAETYDLFVSVRLDRSLINKQNQHNVEIYVFNQCMMNEAIDALDILTIFDPRFQKK